MARGPKSAAPKNGEAAPPSNGEKRASALRTHATLAFRVTDPETSAIEIISSDDIWTDAPRKDFSGFALIDSRDPAGFNFENFIKNMERPKRVLLEGKRYDLIKTRSQVFLTFSGNPKQLESLSHIIGTDAFYRANLAANKKGEMLVICRLTADEYRSIRAASPPDQKGVMLADSILPPESVEDVEPDELRSKLGQCVVIEATPGFDLADFVSRINTVDLFRDERKGADFLIGLKGEDVPYSIYVNAESPSQAEQNPHLCTFRYNNEVCTLFRVEMVG
ncbi:hypothetical protein H0O00_01710 [Candidatus Micrarchaeota archaeon]|nr:hypothetical protein [Candidatus Micrarchaeota archaeon]